MNTSRKQHSFDRRRSTFLPPALEAHANGNAALTVPSVETLGAVMAFSLRHRGWSQPPFDSLNFSVAYGDSRDRVARNLDHLARSIRIPAAAIATCRQVHGDEVKVLESVPQSPPEADALVAPGAGVFPAVKTADCLPILLVDPQHRIAAAVHAGWRGTVLRITRKVVRLMAREWGTDPREIRAALGPAVGPCCYEVDERVIGPFRKAIPAPERFIKTLTVTDRRTGNSRLSLRLDLAAVNRFELVSAGVPAHHVTSLTPCTACHEDLFFSHRRDGTPSGRHIAVTGFRE